MKWVSLILLVAAMMPVCYWLRRHPGDAPKFWMLMGFLPFVLPSLHLNMAAISWPTWPGYVKGTEFSVLDALALALYFSLPRAPHVLPFRLSMALYFCAALLSMIPAEVPMAALFYVWQLARMFLVFAVVTKGCTDGRVPLALLMGMGAGMFMEAGVVLFQRFGLHMLQAVGTIGHQNQLGMITHFIVFPFFALLLLGDADGGRSRLCWRVSLSRC